MKKKNKIINFAEKHKNFFHVEKIWSNLIHFAFAIVLTAGILVWFMVPITDFTSSERLLYGLGIIILAKFMVLDIKYEGYFVVGYIGLLLSIIFKNPDLVPVVATVVVGFIFLDYLHFTWSKMFK